MEKATDRKEKIIADMATVYIEITTLRSTIILIGEAYHLSNIRYVEDQITESMEHFAHALTSFIKNEKMDEE